MFLRAVRVSICLHNRLIKRLRYWVVVALLSLPVLLFSQGLPGVGVGIPGIGIGIGIPINILATYPNPYANKAPAYRSVYLFKASEMGALAGKKQAIRSIYFYDSIPQSAILHNFTIRMAAVTWDTMPASIPDAGLETVYWPRAYVDRKGFNEHVFDVPFCWDGVSNFIVDICVQNPAADVSQNATIKANIPDSGVYVSYHDWNTTGNPICLEAQQVQPQRYELRPLTSFNSIPGDSTDLRMYAISSPADLLLVNSINSVSVRFQNYSCANVAGAKLGYRWNNSPPVIESFPTVLQPGVYANFTFNAPLVAAPAQFSVLKVWTQHPADHFAQNDTVSFLVFVKDGKFEGLDYSGKEFWLAFMQNFSNENLDQKLFLTGTKNATANISYPLLGWSTTVSVVANQVTSVTIPNKLAGVVTATEPGDSISPTGLYVTSDEEISIYGYSGIPMSTDAYLAIPRRTLGRSYVVTAPVGIYNPLTVSTVLTNAPAEFIVIATENNTTVRIIPSAPTEKHNGLDTILVKLSKGQTYLVKARVDFDADGVATNTYDLTGSRVFADKKIGLIGGSQCALIPGITQADKCQSCDHLLEMMSSPSTWGTEFYALDFDFKPGDDIIRLVNSDSTKITCSINGLVDSILPYGFIDKKFTGTVSIFASKPVQAIQMCTGGQCNAPPSSTDPFITTLIPLSQWGNFYTFTTAVSPDLSLHYVNIVKKSLAGRVAFDGYRIPDNYFNQIPGTDFYATRFSVSAGVHKVSGDSALYVTVYGFGRDNSYGYPASGSFLKTTNIPQVFITGTSKNVTCYGAKNGAASVQGYDGTAPLTYHWNDGVTDSSRVNLAAGDYWVFVEDDYGYQDTAYFKITQPDSIALTIQQQNPSCFAADDGKITATVLGGSGTLKALWQDADVNFQRAGLSSGIYSVVISDSLGCQAFGSVSLAEPSQIALNLIPTVPSCHNQSDGKVMAMVQGGFLPLTYSWTGFSNNQTDSLTGIMSGTYELKVTDTAGCVAQASTTINNPEKLNLQMAATGINCFETSTGTVQALATGGRGVYSYKWSAINAPDTAKLVGLPKGWYTVVVSDGACKITDSAYVDSVNSFVANVLTTPASCNKPSGTAIAEATGGSGAFSYSYNTVPVTFGKTASQLLPGNYQVYITDGNCGKKFPFTITNIAGPQVFVTTQDASCGLDNGKAKVDSVKVTGNYSLKWLMNSVVVDSLQISNIKSGSYQLEIKDEVCTTVKSFTVGKIPLIRINSFVKVQPDCGKDNGKLSVLVGGGSGPMQVTWLTNPPQTGFVIDSLYSGVYQLEVRDNYCLLKANVSLSSKNGPVVAATITQPTCDGDNGKIVAKVSGGSGNYTYLWNNDSLLNTNTLAAIPAGSYSLIVDDGACKTGFDTTLVGTKKPAVKLIPYSASCGTNNGGIKAELQTIKPSYQHFWNNQPGTDSIGNLNAGFYVYKVFDGQCWGTDSVNLTALPDLITAISQVDSSYCGLANGQAKLTATGGNGVYDVRWLTNPQQIGFQATGLAAGQYKVIVTDFNCIDTLTVAVTDRMKPSVDVSAQSEHCDLNDGSLLATVKWANWPINFLWEESGVTGMNPGFLDSGWYHYQLNDAYCFIKDSIYVGFVAQPNLRIDSVIPAHCGLSNGMAYASVAGAVNSYNITWFTTPTQTGNVASALGYGDYTVTVSDQFCSSSLQVHVDSIPQISTNMTLLSVASCNLDNGSARVAVQGGLSPFSYHWPTQPSVQGNSIQNLAEGWVISAVSDRYCTVTDSVFINRIPIQLVDSVSVRPDWCGKSNGFARVYVSGGVGNYSYSWQGLVNQLSDSIVDVSAGNYVVQVKDSLCLINIPVSVPVGKMPTAGVEILKKESCDKKNASVRVVNKIPADAGVYWFATGSGGDILTSRKAGFDSVRVYNAYCDTVLKFTIGAVPNLQLQLVASPDTCATANGRLKWMATGGTPSYNYTLAGSPVNGNVLSKFSAGVYRIGVTDSEGCFLQDSVAVPVQYLRMESPRLNCFPLDATLGDNVTVIPNLPMDWSVKEWSVDGQFIGTGNQGFFVAPNTEGNVGIQLVAEHRLGCLDSVYQNLLLKARYNIYIPTSFTPDGDGYNDFFYPVTEGVATVEGAIYNRWGEAIFAFHSLDDSWDGTYNRKEVKTDTYSFKLIFTTHRGEKVVEEGKVTVLR